jgi:hypothetical protein
MELVGINLKKFGKSKTQQKERQERISVFGVTAVAVHSCSRGLPRCLT